jgi:phosphoesterase RecJ-like protein
MRSKGTIDVAQICGLFGGGGHKNAAGCTINGDLMEVEGQLRKAFNIE